MLFRDNYITLVIDSKIEITNLFYLKFYRLIRRNNRSDI